MEMAGKGVSGVRGVQGPASSIVGQYVHEETVDDSPIRATDKSADICIGTCANCTVQNNGKDCHASCTYPVALQGCAVCHGRSRCNHKHIFQLQLRAC